MGLSNWFNRLVHGGTRKFSPSEASILDAVMAALPDADDRILQEQVAGVLLVQRPQRGRMVICYYDPEREVPTFGSEGYEVCLARVSTKLPNGRSGRIKIMLHHGRLQSLEGPIPAAPVRADECEISLWPTQGSTLPGAADRLEHPGAGDA